jgi:hypothetical protein
MGVQVLPECNNEEFEKLKSEGFHPASMSYSSWVATLGFFGVCIMPGEEIYGDCMPDVFLDNANQARLAARRVGNQGYDWNASLVRVEDTIKVATIAKALGKCIVWL